MTQPALLLDAVAMGLLRKHLVETFGLVAARTVLTQLGFAQGWRMAEAIEPEFGRRRSLSKDGVVVAASYEAEQHILHVGRADAPVCWALCGLTSGYLSRTDGEEIFVLEDRCMGQGDAACHLVGRTREEWGEERATDLDFFDPARLRDWLDASKDPFAVTFLGVERTIQAHRRAGVRVVPEDEDPHGIVAISPAMRSLVELARRVGKVDSAVLITGESGTGKGRIARLVHEVSARAGAPFVSIHCGANPEEGLESELFGHMAGSSPGATHDRPGVFEAAQGGTLLLDDVGRVPPALQVKLLRAIQEQEIRRVGDDRTRRVDVRVVATHRDDLRRDVQAGSFRQDLYYRLNVVELHVPPLRERRDDILPLAHALLATAARRLKREVSELAPATADHLLRYGWPGNARELKTAMERAAALARDSRVEPEDLPEEVRQIRPGGAPGRGAVRPLEEVEREYILAALKTNDGNQTRTAEQLRIGTATLYRRLKSYGAVTRRPDRPKR